MSRPKVKVTGGNKRKSTAFCSRAVLGSAVLRQFYAGGKISACCLVCGLWLSQCTVLESLPLSFLTFLQRAIFTARRYASEVPVFYGQYPGIRPGGCLSVTGLMYIETAEQIELFFRHKYRNRITL